MPALPILNGTVPAEKTDIGDYDSDGIADLMVKFSWEQTANLLQTGDAVTVKVSGSAGGVLFAGTDIVRVINEGRITRVRRKRLWKLQFMRHLRFQAVQTG